MLTALILLVLVAGIVYAARRWPDIEARFFGVDKVDVPKSETVEPRPVDKTAESVKEHARNAGRVAERSVSKVTEMAGGLFKKKPISEEPTVEAKDDDAPIFSSDPVQGDDADTDTDAAEEVSTDEGTTDVPVGPTQDEEPATSSARTPGERVGSVPARPSEPAYVDATRHQSDNFEQLSTDADQAWRDREYERCEEACLKILVQQPKNIKYMTRIGQVYQQLGQLDDAKEAFEAAKKLDPRNFFVLNRLTEVERLQSDKKGRTQFNKVLKK